MFKCKKPGHQCCAAKSIIREYQGIQEPANETAPHLQNRNDTVYSAITPHPSFAPPASTLLCEYRVFCENGALRD